MALALFLLLASVLGEACVLNWDSIPLRTPPPVAYRYVVPRNLLTTTERNPEQRAL